MVNGVSIMNVMRFIAKVVDCIMDVVRYVVMC